MGFVISLISQSHVIMRDCITKVLELQRARELDILDMMSCSE